MPVAVENPLCEVVNFTDSASKLDASFSNRDLGPTVMILLAKSPGATYSNSCHAGGIIFITKCILPSVWFGRPGTEACRSY